MTLSIPQFGQSALSAFSTHWSMALGGNIEMQ